jgi:hypothetical protein
VIDVNTYVIDVKTYAIDVNTYVIDVNTYAIDVNLPVGPCTYMTIITKQSVIIFEFITVFKRVLGFLGLMGRKDKSQTLENLV